MRYALGIVIDSDRSKIDPVDLERTGEAGWVHEDIAATLGEGNNFLEDGHACVFVGGPYKIAETPEYDSLDVGRAILKFEFGGEPVVKWPRRKDAVNLGRFLNAMAEGAAEQAEDLERLNDGEETTQSLALRDYFSQMVAVARSAGTDGVIDWSKLDDMVGIDLEGIDDDEDAAPSAPEMPPVYMVEPPFGERETYSFHEYGDAVAFADAVSRPDDASPDAFGTADVQDADISNSKAADYLIAVERARFLEDLGFNGAAEDVEHRRRPLAGVAGMLRETIGLGEDEDTRKALAKVEHWIELDAEHRPHTIKTA